MSIRRRRIAAVLGSILLALSVTGCGAPPTPTAAELRVGGLAPAGTAADRYWQEFRGRLEQSASGLKPVLLTRGELGSDEQAFAALRRGRIQIAINGAPAISGAAPIFALLGAPYLFAGETEVDRLTRRVLEPALAPTLRQHGVELLALLPMGFHNLYGRTGAIARAPGVRGVRLRQPTDPASEAFARALGADLIPLPSSEIVTSLQTGIIDAGTTVTLNYLWTGVADYAPHLVMTRHAYLFNALLANGPWWSALSSAERQLVCGALPSAAQFVAAMRAAESTDLQRAVATGRVIVAEMAASEAASWQHAAAVARPAIVKALGADAALLAQAIAAVPESDKDIAPRRLFGCSASVGTSRR